MTLPNFLTIARLFLVPVIVWFVYQELYVIAFFLFLAAGISDAADGFIAKQFEQRSELGAYLDPLADKVMLVAIYVVLGTIGHLPSWIVIVVVSRDVAIVGAVILSWLLHKPVRIAPHMVSKLTTVLQILLVMGVLAALAFATINPTMVVTGCVVTALLTLASLAVYLRDWLQHMTNGRNNAARSGGNGK
jgi:cardiolipin synthase